MQQFHIAYFNTITRLHLHKVINLLSGSKRIRTTYWLLEIHGMNIERYRGVITLTKTVTNRSQISLWR